MDLRVVYAWLVMNRQGLTKTLVIMNLTAILLLTTALQVTAAGYGQSVTLNTKDAPLQNVFQQIEKQTGYQFFYKEKAVQDKKPVTVQLNNVPLNQALNSILLDRDLSFSIVDKVIVIKQVEKKNDFILSPTTNLLPPINVHGKVVDDKGQPVEGATVTVKGIGTQVSTNSTGEFTIDGVDANATLIISATNIETYEIKIKGKTELAINVKTKIVTGEGIIIEANTGYQKLKPNEINGSVVVIDNKTLNEQVGTGIIDRLNGVTSGMLFNVGKTGPQGAIPYNVRGISTINANPNPLIVLDNFPYSGNINNLNPNDIENITILKDAAATSIYGAQGGNGVIVITTKKNKFNQKVKIDINSTLIISKKPDLYSLPNISIPDYVDVEQFLFRKGYYNFLITNPLQSAITPVIDILRQRRSNLISAADSALAIDKLKGTDSREQYDKYFNQTAITQQYALNIRGGSNNIAWLISGAYDRNLASNRALNDKLNLRISNSYKPLKNLQLDFNIYYTNGNISSGAPLYNSIKIKNKVVPYLSFADENGNALPVDIAYRGTYTDTAGAGHLLNWKYYPLEDYKHNWTNTKLKDLVANVGLSYQVIKSLNVAVNYQFEEQTSVTNQLSDLESYRARNMINLFSVLNRNTGTIKYIVPKGGILSIDNSKTNSSNIRGQLNYDKEFKGGKHAISGIIGTEFRHVVVSGDGHTNFGYNADPLTYANVDYNTAYTLFNGTRSSISPTPFIKPLLTQNFVSVFGNLSYTYEHRYSFSLSTRKDASNNFGLETNDKWNPFWSAGLGWEISKEKFYKVSLLPNLKLRLTTGNSGNVDLSKTALPVVYYYIDPLTQYSAAAINNINNPQLKWEKINELNLGVDFSFKNEIIAGSIDYYKKKSKDLYAPSQYDYTVWGGSITVDKNSADMIGHGLDVLITTKNINNKNLKWHTTILFNYNTNKTTKYFGANSKAADDGGLLTPVVGKPLFGISAYKWAGLDSLGDPQGYVNGQISKDYNAIVLEANGEEKNGSNIVYIGPSSPKYFGSLINQFQWKGFSLSINVAFKLGYYFRKPVLSYGSLYIDGTGTADFAKRWQKPGDEFITNVPAMVYTNYPNFTERDGFYAASEINVLKADHFRLQYINLSYSLNPSRKLGFLSQMQIYLNVSNLGILWRANKEKLDPDYLTNFSPSKRFAIGIKKTF